MMEYFHNLRYKKKKKRRENSAYLLPRGILFLLISHLFLGEEIWYNIIPIRSRQTRVDKFDSATCP